MLLGDTRRPHRARVLKRASKQRNRVDFDVVNGEAFDVFTESLPLNVCVPSLPPSN